MTAPSRSAQFAKVHKVLKKHYKTPPNHSGRTVVEHLLFACCLEEARCDAAEEAFAALVHTFFDWNEVRVTSISELSEVMACLPDPRAAANRIKRILHAVFEATFNFDLEERRKKNLGPTVEWLAKLDGATPFTVAYVVQSALGGHSIPIDAPTMRVLQILDLVTEKDVAQSVVPGLERAVAKAKGFEFGAVLHELGADFAANPYGPNVRDILLQIEPECGPRFPKRRVDRPARKATEAASAAEKEKSAKPAKAGRPDKAAAGAKAKPAAEKPGSKKKSLPAEPVAKPEPAKKKPAARAAEKGKGPSHSGEGKKRSASEGLSKRKPR